MVPRNNDKRLRCLIIIQIIRIDMDNNKMERYINNILFQKETTNVKKKRDKIDNLCGHRKSEVLSKQSINKKFQ